MDRHPLQPPPGAISPLPTEDGSPILGSADHAIPVPRSPLPFPFHASTLSDDELFQHREYYKQLGAIASPDTRSPAQPSPPAVPPFPFDPSSWSDGMLAEALEQWSIPNAALHAGDSSEEGDVDDRSREGATATGGGAADETGELGDIDSTHGDSESMAETLSDRGDGTAPELVEEDRGIETGGQEGGPADPGAGGINVEGMEYQETGRILEESGAMEQSEAESDLTSLDDLSDLSDSRESSHMEGLGSPPSASTIAAALLLASLRKHLNSRSDSHDQEDGDEDDAIADAVRSSINSSFAIVKSPPPSHSQPSPPRIRNPRTGPWSHFHDPSQGSTFVLAGINCALYDEGPVGEPVGQECGRPRTDDAWRSLYAAFRKKTVAIHLFHYQRLVFDAFKVVCQKIPDAILDSLLLAHPFHIKSRSTLDTQALAYGLEDKLYQFVYAFGLEMEVETADEFLKSVEDEEGEFIDNATRKGMGASARAMVKGLKEEIERVKEEGGTIIRATSYVGWAAGFLSALNTHARFEDHLNTGEPHSLFTLILQQVRRNPTFVETSILRLSIVATLASLADFSSSTKMGAEQVVSVAIGSSSFEGGANVNSCGDASVLIAQLNYLSQQSPLDLIVDLPRSPISLCYIVQGKAEKWALEGADCKTVKEFLTEWWARVRSAKAKPSEDVELSEARRSAQERSRGQSAEEQRCKKMEEVLFRGSAYEGLAGGDEQVLSTPRVPGDCPWCASYVHSQTFRSCLLTSCLCPQFEHFPRLLHVREQVSLESMSTTPRRLSRPRHRQMHLPILQDNWMASNVWEHRSRRPRCSPRGLQTTPQASPT